MINQLRGEEVIMKLIAIGDNVVDKYMDLNMMFPGGNSLNVAVYSKRYGIESGYIGRLGTDKEGTLILKSLIAEGVDVARVKLIEGNNAYCHVALVKGERVFIYGDRGVSLNITLDEKELEYIKTFDLIHTSIYSRIEDLLPILKKTNKTISLDYSNDYNEVYLKKTLPYVNYAFFSGSEILDSNIKEFQKKISSMGPELILITKGNKGAYLYYQNKYYEQDIVETDVVDTLGAGDGFIARFLVGMLKEENVKEILQNSAKEAARICSYYGAFGYGIKI